MKRSPMPRRKEPLRSSGRIAPKPRKPTEFARVYGSKARVAWVKSLGCVACAAIHPLFGPATAGSSHNAHTVTDGMGRKAGYETIVPLCATHHRWYDEHKAPFDTEAARDAIKLAAAFTNAQWVVMGERRKDA